MVKKSKLVLALAVALVMCCASIPSVFADEEPAVATSEAAITKVLKVPYGTAIPSSMSFDFEVTPLSVDGNAYNATTGNMPVLASPFTIDFDGGQTLEETVGGTSTYYRESGDIFDKADWPHAGVYIYQVVETSGTYPIADSNHETIRYSKAQYTLKVYVKEDASGAYYIYAIGAIKDLEDDGEPGTGNKSDPTPGGGENNDYSQMIFNNEYIRTNGALDPEDPDPTNDDDSTLSISKKVTGDFGSKELYFQYSLTINEPALVLGGPNTYKAYVVENGAVVTEQVNGALGTDNFIEFTSGSKGSFSLKHDQKLVFVNTPVGTSYDVEEAAATGYVPNVAVVYNSESPVETSNTTADIKFGVTGEYVGELINKADFTNERNDVTTTGLNLNDLPFIGLIALAIGSLVAFVVVKARKNRTLTDQA